MLSGNRVIASLAYILAYMIRLLVYLTWCYLCSCLRLATSILVDATHLIWMRSHTLGYVCWNIHLPSNVNHEYQFISVHGRRIGGISWTALEYPFSVAFWYNTASSSSLYQARLSTGLRQPGFPWLENRSMISLIDIWLETVGKQG